MSTIPRFLLPRFSWTASALESRASSQFTFRAAREQDMLRRGLYTRSTVQSSLLGRLVSQSAAGGNITRDGQNRKTFTSTSRQGRDHHFDTLKFVQRLKDEGFTEEQAVAMMKVLGDVVEER